MVACIVVALKKKTVFNLSIRCQLWSAAPSSIAFCTRTAGAVLFQWHLCMCMAHVEPYRSTVWYYLMVCVCRQHGWNYGRRGRWCHLHSHHRGHHILQVRALNRCFYPVGELLQILNLDDKVELIWVLHVHIHVHVHVRVRVFPYCLKLLARYTISLMKHKLRICFLFYWWKVYCQ